MYCSICFLITPWNNQLRGDNHLGPSASTINEKKCTTDLPTGLSGWGHFLKWGSLFQNVSRLCQVHIKWTSILFVCDSYMQLLLSLTSLHPGLLPSSKCFPVSFSFPQSSFWWQYTRWAGGSMGWLLLWRDEAAQKLTVPTEVLSRWSLFESLWPPPEM